MTSSVRDQLAAALAAGEPLNLLTSDEARAPGLLDESVMRGWNPDRDLAANDLFDLLTGHGLPDGTVPHPSGVQLRGARITGCLVLDFVTEVLPLRLIDCLLDDGINAYAAHLPHLELRACRVTRPIGIPLDAENAQIDDALQLWDSIVTAPGGASCAIDITGARIGHNIGLRGATLLNDSDSALIGDGCIIGGGIFFTGGFHARGAGADGTVRLLAAQIAGQFNADTATLTNDSGPALYADGCTISGGMLLVDGFRARGAGENGAVRLPAADITGQLRINGATLTNDSGPALIAERCTINGSVFLTDGFHARGAGEHATVRLLGAQIAGQLDAEGASLTNDSGPALAADGCIIGGGMSLGGGFHAHGAGRLGAVRLLKAQIAAQLSADGATLTNDSGPALHADGCIINGDVFFTGGFEAHGAGENGAVWLVGARITGQLNADGATLTSTGSTALNLASAQVAGTLLLNGSFSAQGSGVDTRRVTVIDLAGAQLGSLRVNKEVTHTGDPTQRWQLDGCTYTGLPKPDDRDQWLTLLRYATPDYSAQPYQQLAAVHRAAGHDRDVREILIAQRRDQIHRGRLTGRQRAWARFTGTVLGFGWKPWRALYGLAVVFAASVALAVVLGSHGALIHPPQPGRPPEPCTTVEQVGAGLDLGTPLLGTVTRSRERCPTNLDPTSIPAAVLTVSTWALQFSAWVLAALFIAGFTGAVRKT